MIKKICVAYEGSDNSNRAFEFALEFCKMCPTTGIEITILSVAVPPEQSDVIIHVDQIIASMKDRYQKLQSELGKRAKELGIEIIKEIRVGDAAQEILKYLKEKKCDMAVVGQRGKSVIDQFVLGSVSRRIVRYADCNVVVVK